MDTIIITSPEDLEKVMLRLFPQLANERNTNKPEPVYSINQVAKKLKLAHDTVKKKVNAGVIRSTKDGLIPESAIIEYLGRV